MQTLYSKQLVSNIHASTRAKVGKLVDSGIDPQLAVVLVGNNPESVRYVSLKSERAKEVGIILSLYHLEEDSTLKEVEETLEFLSKDSDIHGVILQLPLPEHLLEHTDHLLSCVSVEKDVDGLRKEWARITYTDASLNTLLSPQPVALPPMVQSVMSLLDYYQLDVKDKKVVIVGEGLLVGKPLHAFLVKLGVDVTTVNEETPSILSITREADILICGTGQKEVVTYQWIKEGAIVIDCAADVHFDSVSQVASAVAPSVGGVGPLTVAWLLYNTAQAAEQTLTHTS